METTRTNPGQQLALRLRDAIRILFIIDAAGEAPGESAPEGSIKQLDAEMKLQALDFWVRNPDYLAWEMLNLHDQSGKASSWPSRARAILKDTEPEVRRIEMLRYRFGAWEALDDALATLSSYGLVVRRRKMRGKQAVETSYFLTPPGSEQVQEWSGNEVLSWYSKRASLVAEVAGHRLGSQLKECQHKVAQYHDTKLLRHIPPILNEVRERLSALEALA